MGTGPSQSDDEDEIPFVEIVDNLYKDFTNWNDILKSIKNGQAPRPDDLKRKLMASEKLMQESNYRYGKKQTSHVKDTSFNVQRTGPEKIDMHLFVQQLDTNVQIWMNVLQDIQKTRKVDVKCLWDMLDATEQMMHRFSTATIGQSKHQSSDQPSMAQTYPSGHRQHFSAQSSTSNQGSSVDPVRQDQNNPTIVIQQLKEELYQYKASSQYLERERSIWKKKFENADNERNSLLLRLSKIAGEKLTHNNPAIADLSDQNRPTKLGEKFSELYDNEWTDALEGLLKAEYTEREAIQTLLDTVFHAYDFCARKSDMLTEKTTDAVNLVFKEYNDVTTMKERGLVQSTMPRKQVAEDLSLVRDYQLQGRWKNKTINHGDTYQPLSATQLERINVDVQIKRLKKDVATAMTPIVQHAYIGALWDSDCVPELKPFIKQCIFISWMMVVQSPPLCFEAIPKACDAFNTDKYKLYVTNGTTMQYLVWPALLLYKGGPIITKGVAEAKKSNSS